MRKGVEDDVKEEELDIPETTSHAERMEEAGVGHYAKKRILKVSSSDASTALPEHEDVEDASVPDEVEEDEEEEEKEDKHFSSEVVDETLEVRMNRKLDVLMEKWIRPMDKMMNSIHHIKIHMMISAFAISLALIN